VRAILRAHTHSQKLLVFSTLFTSNVRNFSPEIPNTQSASSVMPLDTPDSVSYRRVQNIRISAHFTHLRTFRNFVFATEVTIFSDHNPLMYLRECAPKSAKLTPWSLGLQEFMHADSNIFHTSVVLSVALPPSVPSTHHSHHQSPLHSFNPGLGLKPPFSENPSHRSFPFLLPD